MVRGGYFWRNGRGAIAGCHRRVPLWFAKVHFETVCSVRYSWPVSTFVSIVRCIHIGTGSGMVTSIFDALDLTLKFVFFFNSLLINWFV